MINVKRLASFILLLYGSVTMAEQLTLAWDANTEPELSGYRLYQGSSSGNYSSSIDVGDVTTYTLTGLREGQTYYFALTCL